MFWLCYENDLRMSCYQAARSAQLEVVVESQFVVAGVHAGAVMDSNLASNTG